MFWLKNWSYLTTSTSSSTLLLISLIFHSDASQSLFCLTIFCIEQFHWLIILSKNLFHFRVSFFQLKNGNKISNTKKRNYCVFSTCTCANFFVLRKISEADCSLDCSKRKNCQFVQINLLVVNLLNNKFYRLNVSQLYKSLETGNEPKISDKMKWNISFLTKCTTIFGHTWK